MNHERHEKHEKEPRMNTDEHGLAPAKGQFLVYQAEDGKLKLDVRFEDESVWLTHHLMAELFQTTKQNISLHIQNIYEEGELVPEATVKKYLAVRTEGNREVKRLLDYYNLQNKRVRPTYFTQNSIRVLIPPADMVDHPFLKSARHGGNY